MINNLTKIPIFTKQRSRGDQPENHYLQVKNSTGAARMIVSTDRTTARPRPRAAALCAGCLQVLALALALHQTAPARQSSTPISAAEFRERLDGRLTDPSLARSIVGISVVRLRDSSVVVERNASTLLHPGSNVKLFTAGAALAILPSGFRFRTSVWCDSDIGDGELRGNLYVLGGGDPLLDTSDVDSLAGMAAAAGIRRIEGDIVADLSLFDTLGWGRGWMWDDEPDPDEGFITPLSFNGAAVSVALSPGAKAGDPLVCRVWPSGEYFDLDSLSSTLPSGTADSVEVTRARGFDRIVVRGTMALGSPPETTSFSVRYPVDHFLHELRGRLRARGIEFEGRLRADRTDGPVHLGTIERGLGEVLARINKESDNLAAESLLKAIAARLSGEPGSAARGLQAVAGYLSGFGVDPGSVMIADGSGVSWYTAVAPEQVTALLRDQFSRAETFRAFYSSLAKAARDGTLAGRMTGSPAAGRVAAKTGTLTGVSAVSGYVTTLTGELLAFSIIVNHFPGKVSLLRALQDGILSDLALLDIGLGGR
jgi:D-alanyl-D-alanine carboxypeptidase/D-alanyl-D-alanine-endopeptidase (penicillin-binding protein 4)